MLNNGYISHNERGDRWFQYGKIFSIKRVGDNFEFAEECDYWHKSIVGKEEALRILMGAIEYINEE